MIKEFINKWYKNKDTLKEYYNNYNNIQDLTYIDVVKNIIKYILNIDSKKLLSEDIHEIDNGSYSGTKIFIIYNDTYCPEIYDYFYTYIYYGSCTVCDILQNIIYYEKGKTEKLINLSLDIIQNFKPMSNCNIYDTKRITYKNN